MKLCNHGKKRRDEGAGRGVVIGQRYARYLSGSYTVELSPGLMSPPGEFGKAFLLISVGIATLIGVVTAFCSAAYSVHHNQ